MFDVKYQSEEQIELEAQLFVVQILFQYLFLSTLKLTNQTRHSCLVLIMLLLATTKIIEMN